MVKGWNLGFRLGVSEESEIRVRGFEIQGLGVRG